MSQDSLFGSDKDPQAFRTIGEVASALGIKPHVLRYWEEQFPMLRPVKRSGGRRYYRSEDMDLLRRIDQLLGEQGYTIKGAVKALREEAAQARASAASSRDQAEPPTDGPAIPLGDGARRADAIDADSAQSDPDLTDRLRSIRERLAAALI